MSWITSTTLTLGLQHLVEERENTVGRAGCPSSLVYVVYRVGVLEPCCRPVENSENSNLNSDGRACRVFKFVDSGAFGINPQESGGVDPLKSLVTTHEEN